MNKLILLCLNLIVFSACSGNKSAEKVQVIFASGEKIWAEVARTPEERRKGLMFRESIIAAGGMLFVFEKEEPQNFWMKNTFVDLDIVYISDNLKISGIFHNVPRSRPSEPDSSVAKASSTGRYVLEVPAGLCDKLKIKEGDRVKFIFQ
ncbi:MAG: DUF192 domain-containing protein [Elusimicrobia bacterium]|nr:DUF192 domain-containing protein [Elusimicrobiota bacterium]